MLIRCPVSISKLRVHSCSWPLQNWSQSDQRLYTALTQTHLPDRHGLSDGTQFRIRLILRINCHDCMTFSSIVPASQVPRAQDHGHQDRTSGCFVTWLITIPCTIIHCLAVNTVPHWSSRCSPSPNLAHAVFVVVRSAYQSLVLLAFGGLRV